MARIPCSFSAQPDFLSAVDRRAGELGMKRSEFIVHALKKELLRGGQSFTVVAEQPGNYIAVGGDNNAPITQKKKSTFTSARGSAKKRGKAAALIALFAWAAMAVEPAVCQTDITLRDGTVLKSAIISDSNPVSFSIAHESGVARVPVENLPESLLAKYHYTKEHRETWEKEASEMQPTDNHLIVENIALKLVETKGLFGKSEMFRYFFRVKNRSRAPFSGCIEIGLFNVGVGEVVTKEKFDLSIPVGGGTVVYLDSFVGPRAWHGDFSIKGCRFSINGGPEIQSATLEELQTL